MFKEYSMKRYILVGLILFLLVGCSQTNNKINKDYQKEAIIEIDYQEVKKKIKDKDNFVLYIGRSDCSDCQEFTPLLKTFLKKNKGIYLYYFDVKSLRDKAVQEGASKKDQENYKQVREELNFSWVPTLNHYFKGKVVSKYQYLDEEYYKLAAKKQAAKKQEFISQFKKWLKGIFE